MNEASLIIDSTLLTACAFSSIDSVPERSEYTFILIEPMLFITYALPWMLDDK
ncbi:hypothetical protein D3C73_625340 [compost metagenome]